MFLHNKLLMKPFGVIYILLVCAFVSVASASAKPDSGSLIVSAVGYYNNKDYARAESLLKHVLAEDPENDAAMYYLGLCSLSRKDVDAAEDYLTAAAGRDSTNFWYRHALASLYAMTSRPELTIDIYEKLLKDFPKKSVLYFDLVELYSSQGEHEKALNTLSEIETVFGMTESIAVFRFNLLLKMKRQEEAYKTLEQYNQKYSSPYVLSTLAEHQLSVYNDSTALAYFDEALELAPDFSPALLGKAETLRMTRRYDEYFGVLGSYVENPSESSMAKADYLSAVLRQTDPKFIRAFVPQLDTVITKVVATHPKDSVTLNLAGMYYFTTGRADNAEKYFQLNTQTYPNSLSANASYVEFLMYQQKWAELSREGRKAFEKFPSETSFLEMASMGDYNLKDYDKVLEICDKVLEVAPSDSSAVLRSWSTKGDVYHILGQTKKAYKAYEKALKVNPDYVYVLNNYAYYLSLEGKKLSKAHDMSRKTIEAEPDNATYLDTFGWILHLLGKPEEAKTHFKRAMLYGGNESPVILDHYAEVLFALGEYDRAMVYWNKALNINKGEIADLEERINMRKQQMKKK